MTPVSSAAPVSRAASSVLEQRALPARPGSPAARTGTDALVAFDDATPEVQLFTMPDAGATPLLNALDHAQRTVDLSCYLVTDARVVHALGAAASRGVKVRVMMEPHPIEFSGYAQASRALRAQGVEVRSTPPAFDAHHNVDHAKFLTVDGQQLLVGSGNLTRSSLGGGAYGADRDFWLDDRRPESVREGQALFEGDWSRKSTAGLSFQNLVVTPDDSEPKVLGLMDGAQRRLLVYNPDLSNPRVVQHLVAAQRRGVDVKVLTAPTRAGGWDAHAASGVHLLRKAGVPVKPMVRPHLHAKAMVADDQAFVGSQNFSVSGLYRNREVGDLVSDPDVVEALAACFQKDYSRG